MCVCVSEQSTVYLDKQNTVYSRVVCCPGFEPAYCHVILSFDRQLIHFPPGGQKPVEDPIFGIVCVWRHVQGKVFWCDKNCLGYDFQCQKHCFEVGTVPSTDGGESCVRINYIFIMELPFQVSNVLPGGSSKLCCLSCFFFLFKFLFFFCYLGQYGCVYEAKLSKDARESNDYGNLTHQKVAVKTLKGKPALINSCNGPKI